MMAAEQDQIRQGVANLERASSLFGRFGSYVPFAIALINHWPTVIELYPNWPVGGALRIFVSYLLYALAMFALDRAAAFAKGALVP